MKINKWGLSNWLSRHVDDANEIVKGLRHINEYVIDLDDKHQNLRTEDERDKRSLIRELQAIKLCSGRINREITDEINRIKKNGFDFDTSYFDL